MRIWLATAVVVGCGTHPQAVVVDGAGPHRDAALDADLALPTDVPVVPCADALDAVYATAAQPNAALGTILACAATAKLDAAAVQSGVGSGVAVTSAVAQFVVAYATRGVGGAPAVSTARVYLPSTPLARPVPLVVAGHGSVGLADMCAPSHDVDDNLPLPYAGRGFAVIAPDFAGLGNAGTQDYLDNRVQGWQLLDGARALRASLPAGLTAPDVILTGYSQGGGAALSAQALIRGDGAGIGQLAATVVYAPEWPIGLGSFDYIGILTDPTQLTIATGLAYSSVAVLRQYAFYEDHLGVGRGPESVPAQFRTGLASAVASQCLVAVGGYIQTQMLHTGDLIDATLRQDLIACINAQGPGAGCSGDAAAYYAFLTTNSLVPDPLAGPVLIVQGLSDLIMPPAQNAACIRDRLESAGVGVDTCVDASADHGTIMDADHARGVAWAESVLAGGARAECPTGATLPSCN